VTVRPVDTALLPADVRNAGPKAEELYTTALDFERVLLRQLTFELETSAQSDGSDGSGGGETDATTSSARGLIPDAFVQSLTASGGVGIARELYNALRAAP
jgi:hypothetical protein